MKSAAYAFLSTYHLQNEEVHCRAKTPLHATSSIATASQSPSRQLTLPPRPVLIAQLLQVCHGRVASAQTCASHLDSRVVDDSSSSLSCSRRCGAAATSESLRTGISTVILDGLPCGSVRVSGRVLCCEPLPSHVHGGCQNVMAVIISDTTGMLALLHGMGADTRSLGSVFGQADAPEEAGGDVATQLWNDDDSDTNDCDIRVGDYVVCTGRLVFSDVEPRAFRQVERLMPQYSAFFTPDGGCQTLAHGSTKNDASDLLSASRSTFGDGQWILLPGAEVPLRLSELDDFGLGHPLPQGTKHFTDASAAQAYVLQKVGHSAAGWQRGHDAPEQDGCGAGQFDEETQPIKRRRVGNTTDTVTGPAIPKPPILKCCVKGRVRVLESANDLLFFILDAVHTHARLRAREHC